MLLLQQLLESLQLFRGGVWVVAHNPLACGVH
jgi:hypothetical protein